MGGSQSKRDQYFRRNDWQQVRDPSLIPDGQNQYTVVRNRITGQLLDRYTLQFPNQKEYRNYLESINYRRNQPNIVRVVHYEPVVVKQLCGASYSLNVYLEHCRSRLSQYQDIPFPDYLYCAMAMLQGYKKLYSKIGRFQVNQQQVMIDNEGQLRVWLNSDFSQNTAQEFRYFGGNAGPQQQYEMVQDIMKIIFKNSDQAEGPKITLRDFYQREKINYNNRVGFQQAKNIIHQYSRQNQILIPNLFKSVYEIYQSQQFNRVGGHDAMSFQNQLVNQSNISSYNDQFITNPVANMPVFQPVQSIVNTVPTIIQNSPLVTSNYQPQTFSGPTSSARLPNIFQPTLPISNRTQASIINMSRPVTNQVQVPIQPLQNSVRVNQPIPRTSPMIRPINQIASPMRIGTTPPQIFPQRPFAQQIPSSSNRALPSQKTTLPPSTISNRSMVSPPRLPNQTNIMPNNSKLSPSTQNIFRPGPLNNVANNVRPPLNKSPVMGQVNTIQPKNIIPFPNASQGQIQTRNLFPGFKQPLNVSAPVAVHPNNVVQTQAIIKKESQLVKNPEERTPTFISNQPNKEQNQVIYDKYKEDNENEQNQQDQMQIQKRLMQNNNQDNQQQINEQKIAYQLKNFHEKQSQREKNNDEQNYHFNRSNQELDDDRFYHNQDNNLNQDQRLYQEHLQNKENSHQNYEHQQNQNYQHNQQNIQKKQQSNANQYQNNMRFDSNQQNIMNQGMSNQGMHQQAVMQNQNQNQNQGAYQKNEQNIFRKVSQPLAYQNHQNQQMSYYSSLQMGQTNVANQLNHLHQLNQTNISGQINQMKEANQSSISNQLTKINTTSNSLNNQTGMGSNDSNKRSYRKQLYYTLQRQIQLDPEIAADMQLLVRQ